MTIKVRRSKKGTTIKLSVPKDDAVQNAHLRLAVIDALRKTQGLELNEHSVNALAESLKEKGYRIVRQTPQTMELERTETPQLQ